MEKFHPTAGNHIRRGKFLLFLPSSKIRIKKVLQIVPGNGRNFTAKLREAIKSHNRLNFGNHPNTGGMGGVTKNDGEVGVV